MKLTIIGPREQTTYDVEYITAQTPTGTLVIQYGHAPMIATLVAHSQLFFIVNPTGDKKTISLKQTGFLDIERNSVTALINQINT